uniref:Class I SAM-dependent methyltransferase n=1 Tax=Acidobacterium capsulatum TaxID=33075 RepID=A0A7V4XQ70_9BACT
MDAQQHWEGIYAKNSPEQCSWFRQHLERSLALIERAAPDKTSPILDVGAGASTLVDDLLARGYRNLTVLDISQAALHLSRMRLGAAATPVRWICADMLTAALPAQAYALWHDRAVFHFLTEPQSRRIYRQQLLHAMQAGGQVILSTFGPQGPMKCSGLDAVRYDAASLTAELGQQFRLEESMLEDHCTPSGKTQQFLTARFSLVKTPF